MLGLVNITQNLFKAAGRALLGVEKEKFSQKCMYATGGSNMKVTIVGGVGKIGQPLCLMLKQSPLIDELCITDTKNVNGLVSELNHVDTNCKVTGFCATHSIAQALSDSKVVVILSAAPDSDKPDLNKQWTANAKVVKEIVSHSSKQCPRAFLAIATGPINSMVPMACEVVKQKGIYNPNTIFGITTEDAVRTNTFAARVLGVEPESVLVPVIGGHTEETIVPVLSNTKPTATYTNEELEDITVNVRRAHNHIQKLRPGESSTLTSAFSYARFIISLVKGMKGFKDIVECAYVPSKVHPDLKYLATPLLLGPTGISKNLGIPLLSEYESCLLDNAVNPLVEDIKKGEKFAGFVDPGGVCDPCSVEQPKCNPSWCESIKDPNK